MKLRKRFWGIVGTLVLVVGRMEAGEQPESVRQAATAANGISANQQVAGDIASAIAREVPESGYTVNIEFRGGVAMLRGNVSSPSQLHRILRAARSRPNVKRVVNELQVSGGAIRTVAYQADAMPQGEVPPPGPEAQALVPATPEFTFPTGAAPQYDAPFLPPFAWPAYAPYPNISAVQYPRQYMNTEWPYIGPFHPYPEPPLDWRKVKASTLVGLKPFPGDQDPPPDWQCFKLRWEDGHWYLSFCEPWWSKRGWLNCLCRPEDGPPPGCGSYMSGYRVCFPQPWCTHMFVR